MSRDRGGLPEFLIGSHHFRVFGSGPFQILEITGEFSDLSIFFYE